VGWENFAINIIELRYAVNAFETDGKVRDLGLILFSATVAFDNAGLISEAVAPLMKTRVGVFESNPTTRGSYVACYLLYDP